MKKLLILILLVIVAWQSQAQSKLGWAVVQSAFTNTKGTLGADSTTASAAGTTFYNSSTEDFTLSIQIDCDSVSGTVDGNMVVQVSNDNTNWHTLTTKSLDKVSGRNTIFAYTTFPYKYFRVYYNEVSEAAVKLYVYIFARKRWK